MSDPLIFISVVRDHIMYNRCIRDNPHVNRHKLICLNNVAVNKGIPVWYNNFLESYDFGVSAWFVFCHEDFEPGEDLQPGLADLSPDALYGPIGARTDIRLGFYPQWKLIGLIEESNKDGSNCHPTGTAASGEVVVETFDCQCLIVHSDLIRKTGLRFDPNLSFDLYVEDFCIQAKEHHNIPSLIHPFKCRHWSSGMRLDRYYLQESYLNRKYPDCCYTGTSSHSIGNPGILRRLSDHLKFGIHRLLSGRSKN